MSQRSNRLPKALLLMFLSALVLVAVFYPRSKLPFELQPGERASRLSRLEQGDVLAVYLVKQGGEVTRVLQVVTAVGFIGPIQLLVEMDPAEGSIVSVSVLAHAESHDYGGYITEPWFLERFVGKLAGQTLQVVKLAAREAGDVVAITGATITSRAAVEAVNLSLDNFQNIKEAISR